jgi:hypothetical protein
MTQILVLLAALSSFGPGVHIREADLALSMKAAADPAWAADAEAPDALLYLHMGAQGPDLENVLNSVTFGHSRQLGYHLLEAAMPLDAQHRLFALGHLAHNCSDDSADPFVVPTLFSGAPLGPFDLMPGDDHAEGESQGILDIFGDLVVGDWNAVVDLGWYFWLDGPEARQRMLDLTAWYCAQCETYYAMSLNCDAVAADLQQLGDMAAGYLGDMDKAAAKAMVKLTLGGTNLKPAAELAFGGLLHKLLGEEYIPTPEQKAEKERLLAGPLGSRTYWNETYNKVATLGPSFLQDELTARPDDSHWPIYTGRAIISGNLVSLLRHLPALYTVQQGLVVDRLRWLDTEGNEVASLSPDAPPDTMRVELRLYSTLPIDAPLTLRVVKDSPGLADAANEVLAQQDFQLTVDPEHLVLHERPVIELTFHPQPDNAVGFCAELLLPPSDLPAFTTCLDPLVGSGLLPFHRPLFHGNFDTYGKWPPSLALVGRPEADGRVLVHVKALADGSDLSGARVCLGQRCGTTLSVGLVALDADQGPGQLEISAPGYLPATLDFTQTGRLQVLEVQLDLDPNPPVDEDPSDAVDLSADKDVTEDETTAEPDTFPADTWPDTTEAAGNGDGGEKQGVGCSLGAGSGGGFGGWLLLLLLGAALVSRRAARVRR